MFNPNEELQIIGIDFGDNPDMQSQYIINKEITELNKKWKLKNRYKESLKEQIKLQQEIERLNNAINEIEETIKNKIKGFKEDKDYFIDEKDMYDLYNLIQKLKGSGK